MFTGARSKFVELNDRGDQAVGAWVTSAEHAAACFATTQYRAGERGFCPMAPASGWTGENWTEHAGKSNREIILIPLIETVTGTENFDAIAVVDGVDFAFFGLGDLAQDMGSDIYAAREQLLTMWDDCRDKAGRLGLRLIAPGGGGFEGTAFTTIGGNLSYARALGAERLASFRNTLPAHA